MIYERLKTKHRERGDARTIPLYGDPIEGNGLDAGVWFRCWNCGFRCKVGRDQLGNDRSRSGASSEVYIVPNVVPPQDSETNSALSVMPVLDGDMEFYETTLRTLADGTGDPPRLTYSSVVNAGCPFCGSKNWRGDYR